MHTDRQNASMNAISEPHVELLVSRWLHSDATQVLQSDRAGLRQAMPSREAYSCQAVGTIYAMRQELAALRSRSTASAQHRGRRLDDWCQRAEDSGIDALRDFARTLRRRNSLSGAYQ